MLKSIIALLFCVAYASAQIPELLWTATRGGPQTETGVRTLVSEDGRTFIAGNIYFGDPNNDFFLMEISGAGDSLWSRQYGGSHWEECFGACMGNDNSILLVGFTMSYGAGQRDVWVVKVSMSGTLIWSRTYGTADDEYGFDIARAPGGGYYVVTRVETPTRHQDFTLMKIAENGVAQWTRNYGAMLDDESRSLIFSANEGLLLIGHSESFGSTLDIWVLRLNANLDSVWSRVLNPGVSDFGFTAAELPNGDFVIGGQSNNLPYFAVLNSDGTIQMSRRYGSSSGAVRTILPRTDSSFITCGSTSFSGVTNTSDLCMLKFTSAGDSVWAAVAVQSGTQTGGSTAIMPDGSFLMCGKSSSNIFAARFSPEFDCNAPVELPGVFEFSEERSTCCATNLVEGFDCAGNYWDSANELVYHFVLESEGHFTASCVAADTFATIALFSSVADPLGTCIAADQALFAQDDAVIGPLWLEAGSYYVAGTANFVHECGPLQISISCDVRLPVDLTVFSAIPRTNAIEILWTTGSESELSSFELKRDGAMMCQYEATNSAYGATYRFVDTMVELGIAYEYQLTIVSLTGERTVLGSRIATPGSQAVVTEYALHQNYPNPFNPTTNIAFDMVEAGHVSISVFNIMGQKVAELVNGTMAAGRHTVTFDATSLSSGLYLYKMEANGFTAQSKMILMK